MKFKQGHPMKITLALLALALFSFGIQAHDGHNHGPGQVQPTKGGVILKAEKFYLEVVGTQKEIKFYPLQPESSKSQMLKPIPLGQVKLSATYALPRGKKSEAVSLKPQADHFSASIDAKNTHRYQVDVSIEVFGEKEKLTYQIEPQE